MNHTRTRKTSEALSIKGQLVEYAPGLTCAVEALGAVPAYRFANLGSLGDTVGAELPGAGGGRVDAVTSTSAAVGGEVELIPVGLCRLEIGQTLAAPADLAADAEGKGVPASTGNVVMAKLLEDSAGDGSVCLVYKYAAGPFVAP